MALGRNHILTPTGKINKPSVALLCQWTMDMAQICPEVIVKGFKKCCISNAMDGRETEEEAENVAVKVMKLGMKTVGVVKLGTVKTVRPIGETG
jgi:hypothetical protein